MKKFIEIRKLLEIIREKVKNCHLALNELKKNFDSFAESYIEGAKDELIDLEMDIMEILNEEKQ